MQPLPSSDRILARHLLSADGIDGLSLVTTLADGSVTVEPYTHETPNTVWTNSDVVLLRPEALSEFLLDDLERMVALGMSIDKIHAWLCASSLLAAPGEPAIILSLT